MPAPKGGIAITSRRDRYCPVRYDPLWHVWIKAASHFYGIQYNYSRSISFSFYKYKQKERLYEKLNKVQKLQCMFEAAQGFDFYRKYGKMVRIAVSGLLTNG